MKRMLTAGVMMVVIVAGAIGCSDTASTTKTTEVSTPGGTTETTQSTEVQTSGENPPAPAK